MKTENTFLQSVLKYNWHKHYTIGSYCLAILILLFNFLDNNLRVFELIVVQFLIAAFCFYLFEFWQSSKIPIGKKPSVKTMSLDVVAGLVGGAVVTIGWYANAFILSLCITTITGVILFFYKKSQIK